jgi:pseudouridine-5'-phosphate glycosidase
MELETSGILIACPIPDEFALAGEAIEQSISAALREAR